MKSWILSTCCVLFATQAIMVPQDKLTPEEAFFLRRVTEFWKDQDWVLVKKQIADFLSTHETSNIHNNLYALLGDILYKESDYANALATYNKISDMSVLERTISRKAQCLYLAGNYDEVIQTLTPVLQEEKIDYKEEMQFILADSLFRKMREKADREIKQELALKAKPLLLELFNTSYQDKVLLPLAEVHRELKEEQEAAPLYFMLADKMPLQKEELLLQAAVLQLEFDPLIAISTFQQVVDLGGAKAGEAACQEFYLLFQNERFSDLVSRAPKIEMNLNEEQKLLFEFCLARSHFKLNQFPEAIHHFNLFIEKESEPTPHKRAAFLTLIHCSQKTDNSVLFDQTLTKFLKDFPGDEEAGKALLLHAQTALQKGDITQASLDLNDLLRDFPDFPDQETLLYDQALLFSKTQQWEKSRTAFIAYLEKYPTTAHSNLIWASIVHSSVQELKGSTTDQMQEKKQQLVSDLSKALTLSNLFSKDEEAAYQFLLGQLKFDLSQFSESVVELEHFCDKHSQHPSVPEAYLLIALAHRELKSNPELFIPAAEKALRGTDDPKHKTALRLQLFNAYLTIKEFDKAAENLYQTFVVEGTYIQPENQLWLASYYLEKDEIEKSVEIYKKILVIDDSYQVNFDPAQTYLEGETLRFASLLGLVEKEKVLRSLISVQNRHELLPWKQQDNAQLELAKTYLGLNQQIEALAAFDTILAKAQGPIRNVALLEKSRLLLAQSHENPSEDNEIVRSVLTTFKDLQIQKQLTGEPVHLEAALDYAELRISLSPETKRPESALFFLNRVKEDFNAKDDPISEEYHEARLRYPEKDRLFINYMKFIDAEILAWEAKGATSRNDLEKADRSKKEGAALLEEVLQDKEVTPYLKQRAKDLSTELK
jgi:tetratricopeptide (TPR) repeat protein